MDQFLTLAVGNLASPMVLFFVLGVGAALLRSDLEIPQAIARALAIYLMLAIGFKGGAAVAGHGIDLRLVLTLLASALLSFLLPVLAYGLLRRISRLSQVDAAAVAAHYGSISVVTLAVAIQAVTEAGLSYEGYIVAAAAIMEFPAILSGLWLAHRHAKVKSDGNGSMIRHVAFNGSIVVLVGAFAIGWVTGADGLAEISAFVVDPFKGVLCLFLLDMGLVAGRGIREQGRTLGPSELVFAVLMPLISAGLALPIAVWLGLSAGGAALFITLAASASYIAVPAAMRLALPQAKPSIYLTMSLGLTFPFNLAFGIPAYIALGRMFA
jgi:hypothetical protein